MEEEREFDDVYSEKEYCFEDLSGLSVLSKDWYANADTSGNVPIPALSGGEIQSVNDLTPIEMKMVHHPHRFDPKDVKKAVQKMDRFIKNVSRLKKLKHEEALLDRISEGIDYRE